MKQFLISLCALLWAASASAGTITITVTTASGACQASCTKTYTDTDANLLKIATANQAGCNVKLGTTCTAPQVLSYWFDQLVTSTVASVTNFDETNLTNTAISGYTPINPH